VYQEKVPTETIAACEFSPFIFSTTLTEDSWKCPQHHQFAL
jgi:hypothetical protein